MQRLTLHLPQNTEHTKQPLLLETTVGYHSCPGSPKEERQTGEHTAVGNRGNTVKAATFSQAGLFHSRLRAKYGMYLP